jgi:hypothetical protein
LGSALALPLAAGAPGARAGGGALIWPDGSARMSESIELVPDDRLMPMYDRWCAWESRRARIQKEIARRRLAVRPRGRSDFEACRLYMRKIPPAVEGSGGDLATLKACMIGGDFGLSDVEFWPLLEEWNATCSPQWSLRDLQAKLRSATRSRKQPTGFKAESMYVRG